jgi:plasmid stability protein
MRNDRPKERKIHIALPEDVHQRLRVKCAVEDTSMQEFVATLLAEAVRDVRMPTKKRKVAPSGK